MPASCDIEWDIEWNWSKKSTHQSLFLSLAFCHQEDDAALYFECLHTKLNTLVNFNIRMATESAKPEIVKNNCFYITGQVVRSKENVPIDSKIMTPVLARATYHSRYTSLSSSQSSFLLYLCFSPRKGIVNGLRRQVICFCVINFLQNCEIYLLFLMAAVQGL